ncbi:MAG: PAS domain S-box protein [Sedimentisphaerales bacterium]|nr:PAS domain S-box protein [Sedimentisphaerales bacterium]
MEDTHTPGKSHTRQETLRLRRAKAQGRRDLTARAQEAQRSAETQIQLESVFRAAPIGIGLVSNRVLLQVNERLCAMTGYRAEELIGQNARILYPTQADYDYVGREKYEQISRHGTGAVETKWRRKDGTVIEILLSSTPLDATDLSKGVTFTALDITERKRAQKRLFEQEQHAKQRVEAELAEARDELVRKTRLAAIGQMSASIAHDLRNPLGAVRNAAYLLKCRLPQDDPKLLEPVAIIEQEVIRADGIITNLLNLTRCRSPNKEAVDLGRLIQCVFDNSPRVRQARRRVALSPDPFIMQADVGQLSQVLANILDNAVDAMGAEGEVCVEATRRADRDVLVVRDTGPGWPAEIRDRLFEPLVTTKTTGTGLGLAICRQIIESHGGTIEAEDGPTQGAAIRIQLPRRQEAAP